MGDAIHGFMADFIGCPGSPLKNSEVLPVSASALGYAKPDTFKGLFLYLRSSQAKVSKTLAFAGSPVPILGNFISELTMT